MEAGHIWLLPRLAWLATEPLSHLIVPDVYPNMSSRIQKSIEGIACRQYNQEHLGPIKSHQDFKQLGSTRPVAAGP